MSLRTEAGEAAEAPAEKVEQRWSDILDNQVKTPPGEQRPDEDYALYNEEELSDFDEQRGEWSVCFCCSTEMRHDLRSRVWILLSKNASKYGRPSQYWPSRMFEILVVSLILVNGVLLLLLCSGPWESDSDEVLDTVLERVELVSAIVFTLEYLARLWSCVEDRRYG